MTYFRRVLAGAIAAIVLAGCGVGPESEPRPLPGEAGEAVAADPSASRNRAGVLTSLYLVRDDQLVAVNRTDEAVLTDEQKIDKLELGPTTSEQTAGLRTALTPVLAGEHLVSTAEAAGVPVEVAPDETAVVLRPQFFQLPSQEQLLVLGQVVLTVTDEPGEKVVFVDEMGAPVGIPLPDGRLTSEPVTAADFAPLITR